MAEPPFATRSLPDAADTLAPDGSEIRILPRLPRGSMVHARLPAGRTAKAVRHRSVEELWYVIAGEGEMWRRLGDREEIVRLRPGVAL
ncbi:MAG: hypothetical protein NZP72_05025, partial [Geminicoccaceae bacterium]|nr:hypothetical protein [Geminicoccaceae bacterium]